MNNIHKEQILNTFYYKRPIKKTGKITYTLRRNILSIYKNISNELKSFIINTFKDDYDNIEKHLEEILYRIKYDIKEIPKCPICGNKVKYNTLYTTHKYDATCGNEICVKKLQDKNRSNTIYKIYGVKNVSQNKEIRKRVFETCLEKYGVGNPLQVITIHEKMKQTNLKGYGVEHVSQSNIIKEKAKLTCLKHYGVEYPTQSEIVKNKIKQSNLEKYGVEYNLQSSIIKEKVKQTCIERYGVDNYVKTKQWKDYYKLHQNEIKEKEYQTKRKNHTFNTSKSEDRCYNILINKYNKENIIRQYKSNVYPFACDLYIKSINTYIECNFHWTHNNHLYNKNNIKDIITKCRWKQKAKTSKYYMHRMSEAQAELNIALDVWCNRDVNKYNTAKKNNLKYLVFYTEKEFKNWFETI